ncbi:hypothetical protein [Pseudomonas aegrilactucae]|uniref:Uncharacterized protein n=1 Tax=Pseudomonas aegrilactucae TaxID=2854028 RepID=A0A9Q3AEV5_9PSED|nr:hypothetical protein [Pseudomonas aegrilactucae]MBV6290162.1 hypothetical protein [Pseudomonas aegrilactucae]
MIDSAEKFIHLVDSATASDNSRAIIESASDDIWRDVANKYPDYEIYILQNRTISLDVLQHLSESDNWKTRRNIAMKRRSGEKILSKLSYDEHPIVRQAVAANKKAPHEDLKRLCSDIDERVSRVAEYHIKLREQRNH